MSSRYQREIEDILEKSGGFEPDPEPPRRKPKRRGPRDRRSFRRLVWLYVKQSLSGSPLSITPGRIMLFGFVLLLSALLIGVFNLGSLGLVAWAGLIIVIIGYAMVLARPPKIEKRWRGQPIDLDAADESWLERMRRRVFRK